MNIQILYDRILTTVKIDEHVSIDMTHTEEDSVLDHVVLNDGYHPLYDTDLRYN